MNELPGQYVGRYHIVEQLGTGGMATVYKAYDSRLERDVAIKFIRPDILRDEMFLKRFEREAKALARLSHPNIVKVLDYGDHDGSPYLVMEFIRGDTLKAKLGKPIAWREAARMLMPIAEALDYTHKQNIIHRDVKPSNFLMTESNHLLLSDFGIAKMLDNPDAVQLTGTGTGIGTPEYMAPEQGLGELVDQRADVYSLGVVFYEMVTGHKPYHADTPMAVMYKQISDPLPPPRQFVPNLSENVEHILFKALAKKPVDRFQDMGAFAKALQVVVETPDNFPTRHFTSQPVQAQTSPAQTSQAQTAFQSGEHPSSPTQPPPTTHQPVTGAHGQTASQPKKSKKIWITCGVLVFVGICIGVVALTGGFGALLAMFGPPPEGLTVNISLPTSVEMGKEFQTVVTMRNDSDKEIKVTEIQVPKVMLEIASINTTSPLYSDSMVYDATDSTGYMFNLPIAPGGSAEVSFYFNPRQTADITGEWDVLVGTRRVSTPLRVIVMEASTLTPTATATLTPTPTLPAPTEIIPSQTPLVTTDWSLVWEDDFSDPESGFFIGETTDYAYSYENGEYKIKITKPSWLTWVYLGYSLSDVQMNIDAKMETGTDLTGYGLLCRYSGDGVYYGFEVRKDGYYSIWLRNNDEYTYLVDWTYDSRIQGSVWQRMSIECLGDSLTLKHNDEIIATVTDSTLSTGDVGVLAESDATDISVISFDNFSLYEK